MANFVAKIEERDDKKFYRPVGFGDIEVEATNNWDKDMTTLKAKMINAIHSGNYYPEACNGVELDRGILITIDTETEEKTVKKTLSIPKWLDDYAKAQNLHFSGILKDALIEKLFNK